MRTKKTEKAPDRPRRTKSPHASATKAPEARRSRAGEARAAGKDQAPETEAQRREEKAEEDACIARIVALAEAMNSPGPSPSALDWRHPHRFLHAVATEERWARARTHEAFDGLFRAVFVAADILRAARTGLEVANAAEPSALRLADLRHALLDIKSVSLTAAKARELDEQMAKLREEGDRRKRGSSKGGNESARVRGERSAEKRQRVLALATKHAGVPKHRLISMIQRDLKNGADGGPKLDKPLSRPTIRAYLDNRL